MMRDYDSHISACYFMVCLLPQISQCFHFITFFFSNRFFCALNFALSSIILRACQVYMVSFVLSVRLMFSSEEFSCYKFLVSNFLKYLCISYTLLECNYFVLELVITIFFCV